MKFWFQGSYTAFIFIYLFIFLSWFLIVSKYCQKESPAEDWSQGLHPKKRDKRWLQIVHFIQFWTEWSLHFSALAGRGFIFKFWTRNVKFGVAGINTSTVNQNPDQPRQWWIQIMSLYFKVQLKLRLFIFYSNISALWITCPVFSFKKKKKTKSEKVVFLIPLDSHYFD